MASSGSRCSAIIVDKEARMILTNSHCAANAMTLDVVREDVPVAVPARVIEIAHDVDLAWITTDDESFWDNAAIKPKVSLAKGLPHISHKVRVVGYPQGGSSISITEGIVSRVDGQVYPNGLLPSARNTPNNLLIMQVDAAINPGNSGGPVFDSDGNLVGLAFAVLNGANSVGYVIPNVHLRNFVAAVNSPSHRWQAQSEIGAILMPVENPGLRKFLRMSKDETGMQVRTIAPGSPLDKAGMVKGDVVLRIDGMPVAGSGHVARDINGETVELPFDTVITEKEHGKSTKIEFVHMDAHTGKRSRKTFDAVFAPVAPLAARFYDAPVPVKGREQFAAVPSYFILWGLVWGVFSNPVLQRANAMKKEVPWSVQKAALHQWRSNPDEEVVVLLQGLGGSTCALHYDTQTMRILQYFNGKKVTNMQDLVNYALDAEMNREEFMRITFAPLADADLAGTQKDPDIVLHRKFCGSADEQAVRINNIPAQFSQDVMGKFQVAMQSRGISAEKLATLLATQSTTSSLMQAQSQETPNRKFGVKLQQSLLESLSVSRGEDLETSTPVRSKFVTASLLDEVGGTADSDPAQSTPLLLAQLVSEHQREHVQAVAKPILQQVHRVRR